MIILRGFCKVWGGEGETYVVGLVEAAHADVDEKVEGRVVVGLVEEVGEVEGERGEVVGGVDGGVYLAQELLEVVEELFAGGGLWGVSDCYVGIVVDCSMEIVVAEHSRDGN